MATHALLPSIAVEAAAEVLHRPSRVYQSHEIMAMDYHMRGETGKIFSGSHLLRCQELARSKTCQEHGQVKNTHQIR